MSLPVSPAAQPSLPSHLASSFEVSEEYCSSAVCSVLHPGRREVESK